MTKSIILPVFHFQERPYELKLVKRRKMAIKKPQRLQLPVEQADSEKLASNISPKNSSVKKGSTNFPTPNDVSMSLQKLC